MSLALNQPQICLNATQQFRISQDTILYFMRFIHAHLVSREKINKYKLKSWQKYNLNMEINNFCHT